MLELDTPSTRREELASVPRWELYRLLADPVRVRLLALTSVEELSIGELADLLREGQPKVSRHATALREAGLVSARKQGTWVLLRLKPGVESDPVVRDAIRAGRGSCERDGTWEKIEQQVALRDTRAREFFARGGRPIAAGPPSELFAYLMALKPLIPTRRLAVDAGTGDGALLEILAPLFDRVVAVDRSLPQLDLARERARRRGLDNIRFVVGEIDGAEARDAVQAEIEAHREGSELTGADVVFASRVLHHAAKPASALGALVDLARSSRGDARGGVVIVLDYASHDDEALRDAQADLWLGFPEDQLVQMAEVAGLTDVSLVHVPHGWKGEGPDRHLDWFVLAGVRVSDTHSFTSPASQ